MSGIGLRGEERRGEEDMREEEKIVFFTEYQF